jgi:hypothetical protein
MVAEQKDGARARRGEDFEQSLALLVILLAPKEQALDEGRALQVRDDGDLGARLEVEVDDALQRRRAALPKA